MIVSELIEFLKEIPQDAKILKESDVGTLIEILSIGTVKTIPIKPGSKHDKRPRGKQLIPDHEWRTLIPYHEKESDKTEYHILIG